MMAIFIYADGKPITPRFIFRAVIVVVVFYVNYSILVPQFLLKRKMMLYFMSVMILLIIIYISYQVFLPIPNRLPNINPEIQKRAKFIPVIFNAITIIIGTVIRMYEQWIINDKKQKEIVSQKNASELEALKNQLNPHFLFNSLNSIYSLTVKKSNDAPEAVITLSELLRYMLYQANNGFVLLSDELGYIENYIKLQRLRIAKNEGVKINIRGGISSQKIRPLLFISYIENAFKYGTDFKGNTEVTIDISVKEEELQFKCINLIGSRSKDSITSGIGMQNTKERLLLLYPDNHWLIVEEKDNKFSVDLKLKLN